MPKKPVRAVKQDRIDLGIRLNHILDQRTCLGGEIVRRGDEEIKGGLILPPLRTDDEMVECSVGSGIVIITGEPGAGKSTLGLQIAVAAAKQHCDSMYISLEEGADRIAQKAKIFQWEGYLADLSNRWNTNERDEATAATSSPCNKSDPDLIKHILRTSRDRNGKEGRIILPELLPRPLVQQESNLTDYYWEQYRTIEFLVRSANAHLHKAMDGEKDITGIRLFVIDSLNMLGVESHNREMINRLFDLFRQNDMMGIFTVESRHSPEFDSTMGDVVFDFSRQIDSGYDQLLLECKKSRFYQRTKGLHPYKIADANTKSGITSQHENKPPKEGDVGIVVYPSVQAVITATTPRPTDDPDASKPDGVAHSDTFDIGWGDAITNRLLRADLHHGNALAVAGPLGTFKTHIATNFLLHGVASNETVLYIRLKNPERLDLGKTMAFTRIAKDSLPENSDSASTNQAGQGKQKKIQSQDAHPGEDLNRRLNSDNDKRSQVDSLRSKLERSENLHDIGVFTKVTTTVYGVPETKRKTKQNKEHKPGQLIVADFPTGMLMPEEFINAIREVFSDRAASGHKITRVVIDDVAAIGTSYPLLKYSLTTTNQFLSSFVHFMNNHKVDLLMVGTTGDLKEANIVTEQACSLANSVLKTSVGAVFGDRYVLLTGDGMLATEPNKGETPPVVLLPKLYLDPNKKTDSRTPAEANYLMPDARLLEEFVGFDTGKIQRPGITLHCYREYEDSDEPAAAALGAIARRGQGENDYYQFLEKRLEEYYGATTGKFAGSIALKSFGPGALAQLSPPEDKMSWPRPKDHTSVRMIDEFEFADEDAEANSRYTRNVLVFAYRNDLDNDQLSTLPECNNWTAVKELVDQLDLNKSTTTDNEFRIKRKFAFNRIAPETLSCLVLDTLSTSGAITWPELRKTRIYLRSELVGMNKRDLSRKVAREFESIHRLMVEDVWSHDETSERPNFWNLPMPTDAAVYVCWYTQIREMLTRQPHLASKFNVCALPGKGFRGDWFLRVEPGSVSLRLGNSLKENLLSEKEDYERFRAGMGIPCRNVRDCELLAWPGAHKDVRLFKPSESRGENPMDGDPSCLYHIWWKAKRRWTFRDYQEINLVLSTLGQVLAGKWHSPGVPLETDYIEDMVKRLPGLIRKDLGR